MGTRIYSQCGKTWKLTSNIFRGTNLQLIWFSTKCVGFTVSDGSFFFLFFRRNFVKSTHHLYTLFSRFFFLARGKFHDFYCVWHLVLPILRGIFRSTFLMQIVRFHEFFVFVVKNTLKIIRNSLKFFFFFLWNQLFSNFFSSCFPEIFVRKVWE